MEILGQILQKSLKDAGISPADAASHIGISETNLYRLFKKDSFEVSYLKKAAALLNLPLSHFLGDSAPNMVTQTGAFNQSGSGNSQKVTGNNSPSISGNNSSIKLSIDDCKQQLLLAQRDVEHLRDQLARADALVEAKEQTINLLRARFDRPN